MKTLLKCVVCVQIINAFLNKDIKHDLLCKCDQIIFQLYIIEHLKSIFRYIFAIKNWDII